MFNHKKIYPPEYLDASISTLIKDIPYIITENNKKNLDFFNSIFNFDEHLSNDNVIAKQYIKISVDTPGYVKSNLGEFKNIKFDKINKDTANNVFVNSGVIIDHNKNINRFKDGERFIDSSSNIELEKAIRAYCHNSDSIYHKSKSLKDVVDEMDNKIDNILNDVTKFDNKIIELTDNMEKIYNNLNINKSIQSLSNSSSDIASSNNLYNNEIVNAYNSVTNSYTYPASAYSNKSLKHNNVYDSFDIANNIKFRYYNVNSLYTKVNNQFMNSLNCDKVSLQTNIIINKTHDKDLIIKLFYDGNEYTCVKVLNNDIDLCRLLLTCIDINEYGPKWYLTDYSGNIELIKIKK